MIPANGATFSDLRSRLPCNYNSLVVTFADEQYPARAPLNLPIWAKSVIIIKGFWKNSAMPTGEEAMKNTVIKASVLALALGQLGGCATTEQIAEIKSMAEKAQSSANAAQQRADSAAATAAEALDTARRAGSAAQAALDCCNSEKGRLDKAIEGMMKK